LSNAQVLDADGYVVNADKTIASVVIIDNDSLAFATQESALLIPGMNQSL